MGETGGEWIGAGREGGGMAGVGWETGAILYHTIRRYLKTAVLLQHYYCYTTGTSFFG